MTRIKTLSSKAIAVITAAILALSLLAGFEISDAGVSAAGSGFYVNGTTICDANGNAFVMRGVNISHAWFSGNTQTSINAAASLGANTVRVVLGDGAQYPKTSSSELQNIINWCKSKQLVCILEVHDATGSDSTSELDKAVSYWKEMKNVLSGTESYVIVNIANEWYGSWNGYAWANGYVNAIQQLRNAGISNMLMVDCAGWGQYPDSIKDYGKTVFNADSKKNTVFSIHMYEYAGGDANTVKTNINNALGIGVPVVIGEFGGQHTNGDVDEYTIMSYCTQKNVGYLGWSWKGNSGGLEYLDIANNWDGSSLTSWGNTLFYDTNGIKNTSKKCTVYTGGTSSSSSSSSSNSSSSSDSSSSSNSSSSSSSASYTSLFYGSASASNWDQAVSVNTKKNGGSFDAAKITSGGHFYVEYTGTKDKLELILQSWSGGSSWGKVKISESGTANGNYYAKFSYNNCVSTFGSSDFSGKLDKIHIGAAGANIKVISVCYDNGGGSSSSSSSSSTSSNNNTSSSNNSSSNNDSSSSNNSSQSSTSENNYTSLFWGNSSASSWGQAVSIKPSKNGGSWNAGNIKSGGYIYVEYSGTKDKLELILQSWSGGSSWGKAAISYSGTANGHYFATFDYNSLVKALGTSDFSGKLDMLHVGAMSDSVTVYSVCYSW